MTDAQRQQLAKYSPNNALFALNNGLAGENLKKKYQEVLMIAKLLRSYAGTGDLDAATSLDVFIAYDIASGEGFHLFGLDAFNDVIATQAGVEIGKFVEALSANDFYDGFITDRSAVSSVIEEKMEEARYAFLQHDVLQNRETLKNAFFSLMMTASEDGGAVLKWHFEPIRLKVSNKADLDLWYETIGTIIQYWVEKGWLIEQNEEGVMAVNEERERELLEGIRTVLTDRNKDSWPGGDGEQKLTKRMVKALFEMEEVYMFLIQE